MSNPINPHSVAKALAAALPDSSVRDNYSKFAALLYYPVKVGNRSPITVYEAVRGQFDGDCQVIISFDERLTAAKALKDKIAVHAVKIDAKVAADPGDAKKTGWQMSCSQVLACLEGVTPVKKEESSTNLEEMLKDPAVKAKLLALLLG